MDNKDASTIDKNESDNDNDSNNEKDNDTQVRQKLLNKTALRRQSSRTDGPETMQRIELSYPLDVIVRKIQTVVTNQSDDSSDDEFQQDKKAAKEIYHALQLQGFKVVEKENGADVEIVTYDHVDQPHSSNNQHYYSNHDEIEVLNDDDEVLKTTKYSEVLSNKNAQKNIANESKFKKGHRRAYSMPNAHRGDRAVLVVADDQVKQEGARKRHIVRYRLHPYKSTPKTNAAVNDFIEQANFDVFNPDDEFDELEMDEEEIMQIPGLGSTNPSNSVLRRFWEDKWKRQNFEFLPDWLQDNEFLHAGHRPQLQSFTTCFKSIFSVHTETGNILTHMYGGIAFIGVAAWFLYQSTDVIPWRDKLVFMFFFAGAILCLGLSFAFHTLQCHSPGVGKLFSKLDYSGITMLIVGSFIPWIYYGFYCRTLPMVIYISMIVILGISALIVSLWDKFANPKYRPLRAGVFVSMGLSSVIPAFHLLAVEGLNWMFENASFHWLLLMGALYLIGASIYASRFPERCFPGKFDIFVIY